MEAQRRTRSCDRESAPNLGPTQRGAKQIVIVMTRRLYERVWHDPSEVRRMVEAQAAQWPELFPPGIQEGFQLHGMLPESKKMPGIRLRQIRLGKGEVYTLRPSFVLPYMMGDVEELEKPLFLLSLGVPLWAVTYVFGRNDMFWWRLLTRLGRNSLVGTTVRDPERLPEHLAADEHHSDWCNEKGYVAMTVGENCFLGMALSPSADEEHLKEAYGRFAREARELKPDYCPKTVNTDGWRATRNAFRALFSAVVVILCFLHGFLKVRQRCRKAWELHRRIWEVFHLPTAEQFREGMSGLWAWFQADTWSDPVREAVKKMVGRVNEYAQAYAYPGCLRTSNMIDRLMNRLTRLLYWTRGLHGHMRSTELYLRGWALLQNFRPYAPRSNEPRTYQSPAHKLNGKRYHPHWLHNLQASASLMAYRTST